MKRSNIALAILAGAVIGGAIALVIRSRSDSDEEGSDTEESYDENENPEFETIAKQFSDRIAAELHAAEQKIKSAVKKGSDLIIPEGEYGVFL